MTRIRDNIIGEYHHLYNRGVHKMTIFRDKADYIKFLFSILYLQSPILIPNSFRIINAFSPDGFPFALEEQEQIVKARFVELVAFCIMPNHFHLLVREVVEGGIAAYMQRVSLSYTNHFNAKYATSGHVFENRYKSKRIQDDQQLMYLSAYIHRNPRELRQWKNKEEAYPYSSLQDYVDKNRWGNLLATDIVAGRFDATPNSNYRDFVRTSPAKLLEEEFGYSK
ncbi:MAG TPA: transposase [Candidatus Paceibacterota bacterium]